MKGFKHSEESKQKISLAKKGKKRPGVGGVKKGNTPWNKGKKLSTEHVKNLVKSHLGIKMPSRTDEHRRKLSLAKKGEKSHLWKGGISKEYRIIRNSLEYRLWRTAVYERDNYTCIWCGERGGKLNADHIKPFAYYPELRFAIDNGRTLCVSCHRKTDTWGRPKNKKYDNK